VTDLLAAIQTYYTALAPILWDDFQFNAVTVADINSPVFLPIINPLAVTGIVTTAGQLEPQDKAKVLTFVGRTTAGGPWKISQFGVATEGLEVAGGKNFRVLAGEDTDVGNAIAALQAGAGTILGNDANTVAFYEYADVKENDRWVKKVRRGA
jgi:hypothetical protein